MKVSACWLHLGPTLCTGYLIKLMKAWHEADHAQFSEAAGSPGGARRDAWSSKQIPCSSKVDSPGIQQGHLPFLHCSPAVSNLHLH